MTRFSIVGQKHHGVDNYLTGTLPGTIVTLAREPENAIDPNAVMVWIAGRHVGYLPSRDAANLAALIERRGDVREFSTGRDMIAADGKGGIVHVPRRALDATFVRSPNSSYPQVELNPEGET